MADKDEEKGGLFGYRGIRDMFDGGGKRNEGDTFQGGGPLSALANAMNIAPAGYHARQASAAKNAPAPTRAAQMQERSYRRPTRGTANYSLSRDMRDGGGMGYEGNSFRGSGYSVLANMLGIKPLGYEDRMAEAQALAGGTQAGAARPGQIAGGTSVSSSLRPMPRPQTAGGTSIAPRNMAGTEFASAPYQFDPVVTPPVSGPMPIDAMPMEELLRIINQGLDTSVNPFTASRTNTQMYGDPLGNGTFIR